MRADFWRSQQAIQNYYECNVQSDETCIILSENKYPATRNKIFANIVLIIITVSLQNNSGDEYSNQDEINKPSTLSYDQSFQKTFMSNGQA